MIATSFFTAASLLATSSSVAAGSSGIIHFTGMIVEPPCSLALDAPDATPARWHRPRQASRRRSRYRRIHQSPPSAREIRHPSSPHRQTAAHLSSRILLANGNSRGC
ncbi:hypothetical protein [Burkholderia ubonensis]|uniref:hypothetical protein n=1 Tax=Burkholderia ubonensis TaxID=101571 RepID=UPI001E49A3A0|nr:hypothetical protein [Burkholderia ubonensis]